MPPLTFANLKQGTVNLREITTRRGSGEAWFTGIEFLDPRGQPLGVVRSGDHLIIRLHFDLKQHIRDFRVGVTIHTELGMMLTESINSETGFEIPYISPGQGHIDFEIDFLNLMPGRYNLSLFLCDAERLHDLLQHCVVMDVEASNFYNSGRGIDPKFGLIFLPCRWKSSSSSETQPLEGAAVKGSAVGFGSGVRSVA
ncbi:MAG: Wzt carbohydrate-binding domain-containing protein [Acidobacteria bacterium]|nr:Wzt carbohydrate-binding domain-containing protein [Acidobacteriota bacterium]